MNLMKKNNTFFKYIIVALISFLIDIGLFTVFLIIFKNTLGSYGIIIATIFARIISSMINYIINRNKVFNSSDSTKKIDSKTLIQYYTLVIVQMLVSSFLVFEIYNILKFNETIIKFCVDYVLFVINYFIQKKVIFIK